MPEGKPARAVKGRHQARKRAVDLLFEAEARGLRRHGEREVAGRDVLEPGLGEARARREIEEGRRAAAEGLRLGLAARLRREEIRQPRLGRPRQRAEEDGAALPALVLLGEVADDGADVAHVTQDVAVLALRHGGAEMAAEAPVEEPQIILGIAVDLDAAKLVDAPAVFQEIARGRDPLGDRGKRKVLSG